MSIRAIIVAALQVSLFFLVLSLGLESRWSDVLHVLRRPAKLVRAIVAVNLIVPALAVGLCLVLPIAPWTKAGIVMMSVSPLAPFAPFKMLKSDPDRSYVVGTYFALMLATIVIIPITATLLRPIAPRGARVPPLEIAIFIAQTVFIPLFAGVAIHAKWDGRSERVARILRITAVVIAVPVLAIVFLRSFRDLLSLLGDGTLFAIAVILAGAFLCGCALGGPNPQDRQALGEAAATRHPGLAATIAGLNANDPRVLDAILLFLVSSILLSPAFDWALSATNPRRERAARARISDSPDR